jgi:uncharacterized protein (TIGR02284 family)
MKHDKENRVLTHLVDINQDASEFYKSAMGRVRNPRLERSFADLQRLHSAVVMDLMQKIRENGMTPDIDGTIAGKTAKLFTEMMTKVSNDVDETLVDHLEEAEDRCLHSMREALDEREMQTHTRALLVSELGSLQRSHDYMKALKDSMHAGSSRAA